MKRNNKKGQKNGGNGAESRSLSAVLSECFIYHGPLWARTLAANLVFVGNDRLQWRKDVQFSKYGISGEDKKRLMQQLVRYKDSIDNGDDVYVNVDNKAGEMVSLSPWSTETCIYCNSKERVTTLFDDSHPEVSFIYEPRNKDFKFYRVIMNDQNASREDVLRVMEELESKWSVACWLNIAERCGCTAFRLAVTDGPKECLARLVLSKHEKFVRGLEAGRKASFPAIFPLSKLKGTKAEVIARTAVDCFACDSFNSYSRYVKYRLSGKSVPYVKEFKDWVPDSAILTCRKAFMEYSGWKGSRAGAVRSYVYETEFEVIDLQGFSITQRAIGSNADEVEENYVSGGSDDCTVLVLICGCGETLDVAKWSDLDHLNRCPRQGERRYVPKELE